jgi:hypothetical protein
VAVKYARAHNPTYAEKQQITHEVAGSVQIELGFARDLLSQVRTFEHGAPPPPPTLPEA